MIPGQQKYGNKKVTIDGCKFDSILEGNCYKALKEYPQFTHSKQEVFIIQDKFRDGKKAIRKISYKADFVIRNNGHEYVFDAKGFETPEYILKRKLLLYRGTRIINIKSAKKMREAMDLLVEGKDPQELQIIVEAKKAKKQNKLIKDILTSLS